MTRRTSRRRTSRSLRRNSRLTDLRAQARDYALANAPGWGKEILRAWSNPLLTDAAATKHVLALLAHPAYTELPWNIRRSVIQILADTGFPEDALTTRHRGTLRANNTRYTTRTPVRPDIHVDEHSSEAEIIQAWRSGRLGIKTAERILIARPDVFRRLRILAQNGIDFQWRRTTNRAGMGPDRMGVRAGHQGWRATSHTRSPGEDSQEIQWEIAISGSDADLWYWDAEYDPAGVQKYLRKEGTSKTLRAAQAASEAWIRRTATRTAT